MCVSLYRKLPQQKSQVFTWANTSGVPTTSQKPVTTIAAQTAIDISPGKQNKEELKMSERIEKRAVTQKSPKKDRAETPPTSERTRKPSSPWQRPHSLKPMITSPTKKGPPIVELPERQNTVSSTQDRCTLETTPQSPKIGEDIIVEYVVCHCTPRYSPALVSFPYLSPSFGLIPILIPQLWSDSHAYPPALVSFPC